MILTQNYKFTKFGPETEIFSNFYETWHNFYETWHSQQIEHAKYEYNTHQCLEDLYNYWLRIIIGSESL